jgi:ribose 5-phosphate isomerase B
MPAARKPAVHLGTDHAGVALKDAVKDLLVRLGYHVHDHGSFDARSQDDYPDFVIPAAAAVAASRGGDMGIVFGGSGIGECIAANKVRGVRAALAYDAYTAKMSRLHNDANVLCLGSRTAAGKRALAIVRAWLGAKFSGDERHVRRLRKIAKYERRA